MAITQSSASKDLYKSMGKKSRLLAFAWLLMALLSAAAALAIWMFTSAPALDSDAQQEQPPQPEVAAFNIAQVTHIDKLDELSDDVHPISFDALVRELRDYPPEFKDSKYLKKNKGKWTLQVMDVSEHSVITDYLSSRKDREKFAYFRYRDANNEPRYLLTYDVLTNEQSAIKEAGRVDFELPSNVQVIPEKIASYLDVIESYELSAPIKDLSRNRARQVKLQPTQRELEARRKANEVKQRIEESNAQKSEARASSSESAATDIQASPDSNETLAVQEERKVIIHNEQSGNQSDAQADRSQGAGNQGSSSQNQNTAKPKVEEPVSKNKSQDKAQDKPAADNNQGNSKSASANSNRAAEADPIKQLIDEKTQQ